MSCLAPLGELRGRVHRGVHVAREARLRFGEGGRKGRERHGADHEKIDVAGRHRVAPGDGSVNERDLDPLPQRLEGALQDLGETDRLEEQALEVRQDGTVGVRLVVDQPAFATIAEDAGGDERGKLALQAGWPDVEVAGQVGHEPPPVRVEERGRQDLLADPGKQGVEGSSTHDAYSYTPSAYLSSLRGDGAHRYSDLTRPHDRCSTARWSVSITSVVPRRPALPVSATR